MNNDNNGNHSLPITGGGRGEGLYNTATLDNGLRVIQRAADSNIVYCGYAIKAGTRDEEEGEEGLAHFCEHASFKGTTHRSATQVIQALESLGGELNAYTNKESTVYYCAILKEHLQRAVRLLTEMVFSSTYPDIELEKEKEVICDEIESYNDSPAELIFDDFENIIFQGHPLGHNILGTAEAVRSYTSADARRFTRRHYRPDNAIFFLSGDINFKRLLRILETPNNPTPSPLPKEGSGVPLSDPHSIPEYLLPSIKGGDGGGSSPSGRDGVGVVTVRRIGSHQSHVMIGRRGYDIHHPRRIALYLLNNIIGGPAMSSRLNMALRERHGLVYTVESSMVSYGDTGLWSIYFGCDQKDVKRCLRLVRKELDRLMARPISERQLANAKQQLKGQIALACDSRENFALDFAKSFLHYGWEKDVSALCAQVEKLTINDLHAVAKEMFAEENLHTLIYQ